MEKSNICRCPIHGTIELSPIAMRIVSHPMFARLAKIKQTGACISVFPTMYHTRFEHSIGVYYLTGLFLESLLSIYPNKKTYIADLSSKPILINSRIVELVKIAGLCHDLGHGPYSHMFDNCYLANSSHTNRNHEIRSCLLVDIICAPILKQNEISFIKSLIHPSDTHSGFIYEIVANNRNGIDVDKFDYLIRDLHYLSLDKNHNISEIIKQETVFNVHKIISAARIIDDRIVYDQTVTKDLENMLYRRLQMHRHVYTNSKVKLVEMMIIDKTRHLREQFAHAITDMKLFSKLDDKDININDLDFNRFRLVGEIVDIPSATLERTKINVDKFIENMNILHGIDHKFMEIVHITNTMSNCKEPFSHISILYPSGVQSMVTNRYVDKYECNRIMIVCKKSRYHHCLVSDWNLYFMARL